MPTASSSPPSVWLHHLEDEADAAYLYRELARLEPDRRKSELYQKLASVEDRHVELWRTLLAQNGHATGVPAPSRAARFRAWIARRLGSGFLLPMLLEATRVLEDGIVNDVRDVDLGLILGIGFPPFKGGLFFWADTIGPANIVEKLKQYAPLGKRFEPTAMLTKLAESGAKFYDYKKD